MLRPEGSRAGATVDPQLSGQADDRLRALVVRFRHADEPALLEFMDLTHATAGRLVDCVTGTCGRYRDDVLCGSYVELWQRSLRGDDFAPAPVCGFLSIVHRRAREALAPPAPAVA